MKLHMHLSAAKRMLLNQQLFVTDKDSNIIEVALEKDALPFIFLLVDEDQFDGIAISVATDFYDCVLMADLVINLMHIANVAQGEQFYVSDDGGEIFWGEEAQKHMLMNDGAFLMELEPPTESRH